MWANSQFLKTIKGLPEGQSICRIQMRSHHHERGVQRNQERLRGRDQRDLRDQDRQDRRSRDRHRGEPRRELQRERQCELPSGELPQGYRLRGRHALEERGRI